MRKVLTTAMSAILFAATAFATPVYADSRHREQAPPPHQYWQNRGAPPPGHDFRPYDGHGQQWQDRSRPPPNWDRGSWDLRQRYLRNHRHDDHDSDATIGLVVGALLGFALGAAVVDSQDNQRAADARLNDPAWIAYCARRYNSFDPYTGTYLGNDGLRHYCR